MELHYEIHSWKCTTLSCCLFAEPHSVFNKTCKNPIIFHALAWQEFYISTSDLSFHLYKIQILFQNWNDLISSIEFVWPCNEMNSMFTENNALWLRKEVKLSILVWCQIQATFWTPTAFWKSFGLVCKELTKHNWVLFVLGNNIYWTLMKR